MSSGALVVLATAVVTCVIGDLGWLEWTRITSTFFDAVFGGVFNSFVVLRIEILSFWVETLGTHVVIL